MGRYVTIRNVEIHVGFIFLLCIVLALSTGLAALYYTKTIDHQARIVVNGEVQTYLDLQCTQALDSKDWGDFDTSLGDHEKVLDFYLRNEGNVAVNVTWSASGFSSYNATAIQYQASHWIMYLVKVDGSEVRIKPENATAPDKLYLDPAEVVHLKFYLTAVDSSPPGTIAFDTSFNSKSD
jgi:hypothetical protein